MIRNKREVELLTQMDDDSLENYINSVPVFAHELFREPVDKILIANLTKLLGNRQTLFVGPSGEPAILSADDLVRWWKLRGGTLYLPDDLNCIGREMHVPYPGFLENLRVLHDAGQSSFSASRFTGQYCLGGYYEILEETQKETMDVTLWMDWFLGCLHRAIDGAETTLGSVLAKARFWDSLRDSAVNEGQRTVLNRLLDGFEGKLTTSKWAKLTKSSHDTALRDIAALLERGVLVRNPGGGRSTSYTLARLANSEGAQGKSAEQRS
jgi:hypothetical protein